MNNCQIIFSFISKRFFFDAIITDWPTAAIVILLKKLKKSKLGENPTKLGFPCFLTFAVKLPHFVT